MPVLEARACGAAVITSDLPELGKQVGKQESILSPLKKAFATEYWQLRKGDRRRDSIGEIGAGARALRY